MKKTFGKTARVYCGDALEILPRISTTVALVLSDPPYGISYEKWDVLHDNKNSSLLGEGKKRKRSSKPIRGWSNADKSIGTEYGEWVARWVVDLPRICLPASALLFYNSRRLQHYFVQAAVTNGLMLQDTICFVKPTSYFQAFRPFPDELPNIRIGNLSPKWEPILVFRTPFKGTNKENIRATMTGGMDVEEWKTRTGSYNNVITGSPIKNRKHPTQKDVPTLEALIRTFCPEGGVVFDPFMGSGSTGVAAIKAGRRFLGIERDPHFYSIAVSRIQGAINKYRGER